MNTVIFGIDPGLKGGISVIYNGRFEFLFPMPVKKDIGEIDGYRLFVAITKIRDLIRMMSGNNVRYKAFIEKVNAMPGQGVCSMFTFGEGYGVIKSVIGLHMSIEFVSPQTWKKVVLIGYDWKQSVSKLIIPDGSTKEQIKKLKADHNKLKAEAKKRGKAVAIEFIHDRYPYVDLKQGAKVDKDGLADSCCIALYGAYKENIKIIVDN